MDCLFCAIVAGDIPSRTVFEDEHALAFLDINPWQQGHTLVIPKRHVADVFEGEGALAEIVPAIQQTARLLRDRLDAQGMNVLTNAGAVSGQEVFHLHVHLLPRFADRPGIGAMKGPVSVDLDDVHDKLKHQ